MPLDNLKYQRFAEEYVVDFNATRAAEAAGFSPKSAHNTGSRLLQRDDVQGELRRLMRDREIRTGVTADRVVEELALIAFSDIGDIVEWGEEGIRLKSSEEISPRARRLVRSLKQQDGKVRSREITLHDKLSALDKLAKHTGVYTEQPPDPREVAGAIAEAIREIDRATMGREEGDDE